jgi:hypothetical protein
MQNTIYPFPHAQTASTVVENRAVIVLADAGEVTILNELGTQIWELADGSNSVENIARKIVEEFDVGFDEALQDTQAFLNELVEKEAIVWLESPRENN